MKLWLAAILFGAALLWLMVDAVSHPHPGMIIVQGEWTEEMSLKRMDADKRNGRG